MCEGKNVNKYVDFSYIPHKLDKSRVPLSQGTVWTVSIYVRASMMTYSCKQIPFLGQVWAVPLMFKKPVCSALHY